MDFAQQLVNGVQIGSVYALVAIGYTMVYGIAKMINFAHGDIIMVGSYVALLFFQSSGLPVWGVIASHRRSQRGAGRDHRASGL